MRTERGCVCAAHQPQHVEWKRAPMFFKVGGENRARRSAFSSVSSL
jgi:hypothetical protein